eukprot:sb/3476837/
MDTPTEMLDVEREEPEVSQTEEDSLYCRRIITTAEAGTQSFPADRETVIRTVEVRAYLEMVEYFIQLLTDRDDVGNNYDTFDPLGLVLNDVGANFGQEAIDRFLSSHQCSRFW